MTFTQPPLPYAENALAPVISSQTVGLHYSKHHASYFTNLNKLAEGTEFAGLSLEEAVVKSAGKNQAIFNQAGQAWNHILYWDQMKPGGSRTPSGKLKELIERDFGTFEALKDKLVATTVGVFGSGWGWLALDGDKLVVTGTSNGDNPLAHGQKALAGVDVWEHAYYLDYQNRRPDHVRAVVDTLINWSFVGDRLSA